VTPNSLQAASLSNTSLVTQAVTSPIVARGVLADHGRRCERQPPHHDAATIRSAVVSGGAGPDMLPSAAFAAAGAGRGVELRGLAPGPGLKVSGLPLGQQAEAPRAGGPVATHSPFSRDRASGRSVTASAAPTPRDSGPGAAAAPDGGGSTQGVAGRPESGRPTTGAPRSSVAAGLAGSKGLQGVAAALPEATGLPLDDAMAYLILLRRHIMFGPSLGLAAVTAGAAVPSVSGLARSGPGASVSSALEPSASVVFSQAG
jgi:hypothetical protein